MFSSRAGVMRTLSRGHHQMRAFNTERSWHENMALTSRYRRGGRGGYSSVMTGHGHGVVSDACIAATSPDERRDLIQRLQRPLDEVHPPRIARRMRRNRLTLMVGGAIGLILSTPGCRCGACRWCRNRPGRSASWRNVL